MSIEERKNILKTKKIPIKNKKFNDLVEKKETLDLDHSYSQECK